MVRNNRLSPVVLPFYRSQILSLTIPQKRIARGSRDPLVNSLITAIDKSRDDSLNIELRHLALNKQLSEQGLRSIDVISDGNCLFRTVSKVIYGSKNRHGYSHQQAANIVAESGCILDGLIDKSPGNNHSLAEHLKIIRTPGKAVGEDMIIALAKFSKCCIKVHIAHSEPLIYQPLTSIVSDCSVNIVFYESGHYRAVLPIDNACNDGDMQLDNINTFIYRSFSSSASLRTPPYVFVCVVS